MRYLLWGALVASLIAATGLAQNMSGPLSGTASSGSTARIAPTGGTTTSALNDFGTRVLNVVDFGAKCDGVSIASDGAIASGHNTFTSTAVTFASGDAAKYISIAGAGATSRLLSAAVSTPGTVYAPQDTATDGTSTWIVATTSVASATVPGGTSGTLGTPGTQTVTGTTGGGTTKFQASVTVNGGGAISAVLSITVAGSYTQNPTAIAAEPVTGAGLVGAQLTVVMQAATVIVKAPGSYTNGSLPGTLTQTSSSGSGAGLVVTPTFSTNPLITTISSVSGNTATLAANASTTVTTATEWEYGTDNGTAINAGTTALSTAGGTLRFPAGTCFTGSTIVYYSKETLLGDGPETSVLWATSALTGPLLQSSNFASLVGTNSANGTIGVSLMHMRFNGNAANASSVTDVIDHYGARPLFDDIQVWNANQRNIWSEWGTSGGVSTSLGSSLEASWYRVTSYQTVGYGTDNIYFNGPHDERLDQVLAINAGQGGGQGIWFGTHSSGGMITNSHVWATAAGGQPQWSWLLDGNAFLTNSTGEGASVGTVKMRSTNNTIIGGSYYRNPQNSNALVCFQIGDATAGLASGQNDIFTTVKDCEGAVVNFDDSTGRNTINVNGSMNDSNSTFMLGTPATTDEVHAKIFNDSSPQGQMEFHPGGMVVGAYGASGVVAGTYNTNGLNIEGSGTNAKLTFLSPSASGDTQGLVFANPLNANDGAIFYNNTSSSTPARSIAFWTSGAGIRAVLTNVGKLGLGQNNPSAELVIGASSSSGNTHLAYHNGSATAPSISSGCGTGSPSVAGTDGMGRVTVGTGGSSACVISFGATWTNAPACHATDETKGTVFAATASGTLLTLTGSASAADTIAYTCTGYE